jgi:hypothetical protein
MGKRLKGIGHFDVPPGKLDAITILWTTGRLVHRIHSGQFAPNGFNSTGLGNARFSPILNATGKIVPTLYAGESEDCALMETVFHDVPFTAEYKQMRKSRLDNMVRSRLTITTSLRLIDLSTIALRRLGVERKYLIDSSKVHYPESRHWAIALYEQNPDAQGLCWTSRQHDSAKAIILFGDRVDESSLAPEGAPEPLISGGFLIDSVITLADRLGVTIIS